MGEITKRVQELLNIPNLCKRCGLCCVVTTFSKVKSIGEIKELIENPETDENLRQGAIDYLSIFEPYPDNKIVEEKFPEIYKSVLKKTGKKADEITFFKCKHYDKSKGGCQNYENRPNLCRVYPVVHSSTFYFPDCGYKEEGERRWAEIEKILADLENAQKQDSA